MGFHTPCLFIITIEQIPIYASAIAAICAAYAAYKSWSVSKSSFNLQRAYIQNQDLIVKINSIIEKLEKLSIVIMRNPLELSDNELEHGDLLLTQIKESLALLKVAAESHSSIPNMDSISGLIDIYEISKKESMYIENSINKLKKYRNMKLT